MFKYNGEYCFTYNELRDIFDENVKEVGNDLENVFAFSGSTKQLAIGAGNMALNMYNLSLASRFKTLIDNYNSKHNYQE